MKKCRSFLLGVLVTAIVFCLAIPAIAAGGTVTWDSVFVGAKIVIDGESLQPKDVNGNPVDAVIYKGTTYLPVRAIANGGLGPEHPHRVPDHRRRGGARACGSPVQRGDLRSGHGEFPEEGRGGELHHRRGGDQGFRLFGGPGDLLPPHPV